MCRASAAGKRLVPLGKRRVAGACAVRARSLRARRNAPTMKPVPLVARLSLLSTRAEHSANQLHVERREPMLLSGGDGNFRRVGFQCGPGLRLAACVGQEESSISGEPSKRRARDEMEQGGQDKTRSRHRESVKGRSLWRTLVRHLAGRWRTAVVFMA